MRITKGWHLCLALCGLLLSLVASTPAQAQNNSVEIGVGDTTVQITGTTSPGALVTILDGGSVIGSVTADAGGEFAQVLTNQTPGIRSFDLFAEDTAGRLSDTITVTTNVQEHFQTTVTVFLPPIVRLVQTEVVQGQPLVVEGSTAPGATVVINVDNTTDVTVTAGADGNWTHSLDTTNVSAGQHWISAMASTVGAGQSYSSQQRSFTIASAEQTPVMPSPSPPATPPPSSVPSSPSPRPPIIISPKPGDIVSGDKVDVIGTAEPGTQIEVWNRDILVGSVFADASGNWKLSITLNENANSLKARACLEGVCSAFSATTQFSWQASGGAGPIIFLDKYRLRVYQGDTLTIMATIRGGSRPYEIKTDWGDTAIDKTASSSLQSQLVHWYRQPGQRNGVVTVTDANGRQALAHFSVEVLPKPVSSVRVWLVTTAAILITGGIGLVALRWLRPRWHRKGRIKK